MSTEIIEKRWFNSYELLFLVILSLVGASSSVFTFSLLNGYQFNFGKNLIGLFIPPFLCIVYLTAASLNFILGKRFLVKALCLYCIQIIPFTPLFLQVFQPTAADDFSRYYLYAKNMVDNHTLWGGDKLFFTQEGHYYVTQPGYRYFVAAELLLFGKLYRFVSFLNIAFLLMIFYLFLKLIQEVVRERKLKVSLALLVLLFTPYSVKNLLMGLPEWLAVSMLMLSAYLYLLRKKELAAMFLLGLVPFFRQNLLFTVLLLALLLLFYSQQKMKLLICFVIPLLLPLYHNLYYAGEWRFFVRVFELPFLKGSGRGLSAINFDLVINNVVHYFGVDIVNGSSRLDFIAIMFLPYSVVLYFIFLNKLNFSKRRVAYVVSTMSAILPAIFLGTAYYPRFEFVNVVVVIVTFLLLHERIVRPNPIRGL